MIKGLYTYKEADGLLISQACLFFFQQESRLKYIAVMKNRMTFSGNVFEQYDAAV
jgi:hypothetical protein